MTSAADLDQLMHLGWPAPTCAAVDGWLARVAGGVTRRANSVFPAEAPDDTDNAIAAVERFYAAHDLPARFQISPGCQPRDLDRVLHARGYTIETPTLVQTADPADVTGHDPAAVLTVADTPDDAWMNIWWAVDGRGDPAARAVAHRILTGGPARYVTVADEDGPAAVGRVALVGAWGGIYCMAVRAGARRRGLGTVAMRALAREALAADVTRLWLQVRVDNAAARGLYARAGFATVSSHHYRVRSRVAPAHRKA